MSKYDGVQLFVNMKTCIFLITILGFIELVFCGNLTELVEDESNLTCPISLFRRKRADREYTRWRSNMATAPEFIVKVLDDEVTTTTNTNQIVAVNILPVSKRGEKIIVGGAIVPTPTASSDSTEVLREYTRFVRPSDQDMTQRGGDMYLAGQAHPIRTYEGALPKAIVLNEKPMPLPFLRPIAKINNRRDESPPAGPQFITRSGRPTMMGQQYAPIAPVAFLRQSTPKLRPVTPPAHDYNKPTDTSYLNNYKIPTRSLPPKLIPFPAKNEHKYVSRTTTRQVPNRTTRFVEKTTKKYIIINIRPTKTNIDAQHITKKREDDSFLQITTKQQPIQYDTPLSTLKDIESDYNLFFYNEDDLSVYLTKKPVETTNRSGDYDEKSKDKEENYASSQDKPEYSIDDNVSVNRSATEIDLDMYDSEIQEPEKKNTTTPTEVVSRAAIPDTVSTETTPMAENISKPICSMVKIRQLNFNSPRTLPEIVFQLKQWAEDSPITKWVDITDSNFTTMENPIYMMIIDDPSSGQIVSAKETVMIIAGIQGRDHHAVASAMYILYQLIERSEAHVDLLTKYRFWIIPVFNPDGYDYSMTFPHRREWAKNLRQMWDNCKGRESCLACNTHGLRCTIQPCYGVNLDRNFEYQWIPTEELKAEHPCGPLYAGDRQLSEPETRAFTLYLHEQHRPLVAFIAFKEGDVLGVMYPYSHTKKKRAFDNMFRQRASRAAAAAHSIGGRPYVAGQTSEFLPLYAGGIEDWVDSHIGVDDTYTIMMFRPADSDNSKLITERVVHEAYAATDTLLMQNTETTKPPAVALSKSKTSLSLSPASMSTLTTKLITCYYSLFYTINVITKCIHI